MGCCDSSNSLFQGRDKFIKFFKEKLIATDAAATLADLSFCGLKINYNQILKSSIYLPPNTSNIEVNYGGLGTDITFFAMKAIYDQGQKDPNAQYIDYYFKNEPDVIRHIGPIMILSGTDNARIETIFLNNPDPKYSVRVDFMAATGDVVFRDSQVTQISNQVYNIDSLTFNSITNDLSTYDFIIKDSNGSTLAVIGRNSISNIEINGRIIIFESISGDVYLTFIDEFNANQAFSLINWSLANAANIIQPGMPADLTSPVITFQPSLNLNWVLADYPDGNGGYLITKQMIIDTLIDNVTDDRDGLIYLTEDNITITVLNTNISQSAITEEGKYNILIEVEDIAKNSTVENLILNVKDINPAKIIVTTLASNIIINNGTNGTSGYVQPSIYLQDFGVDNIMSKQDFINLFISEVVDLKDGSFALNTNNITVTITEAGGPTIYPDVDTAGDYDIRFTVEDYDANITSVLWQNANTVLPLDFVTVTISTNQPPVIHFKDVDPQYLLSYDNGIIVKDHLKTLVIDTITDDRDIVINATILNISILKSYDYYPFYGSTAGTSGFIDGNGTNGIDTFDYEPITPVEKLYIIDPGIYSIKVDVTDSDGAESIDFKNIEVRS